MFYNIALVFAAGVASASAFVAPASGVRAARSLQMVGDFAGGLPGSTAPIKDFDPAGFSNNKPIETLKKYREAELKHGRVAMLASLGLLTQEVFKPFFGGKIAGVPINHYQQIPVPYFWVPVLLAIGAIEFTSIKNGWQKISPQQGIANMEADYTCGDLGFDPLGLCPADEDSFRNIRTKELNNGRLAMIGVAGIVAQELVDHQGVLEHAGLIGPILPDV